MTDTAHDPAARHPIDRHVGLRIRLRRREVGLTQGQLAEAVGLTFQQIQKYERASNRVSASKLWEIAQALRTNVAYFYESLSGTEHLPLGGGAGETLQRLLLTPEGLDMADAFPRVADGRVRRRLELVRAVGEDRTGMEAAASEAA